MWIFRRRTFAVWEALFVLIVIAAAASVLAKVPKGLQPQASTNPGEIIGSVYFRGEKPKPQPVDMSSDPACAALGEESVYAWDSEINENGTLPNAFVYVKSGSGNLSASTPHNSIVLTQQGCLYEPHVLGVMTGQPIQVVTLDPTTHNVHFMPKVNRDWNVTQEPGSASVIHVFTQPEVMIPVHCNIHPWMKAYVGVVSNPYYAVTDKQGNFVIKNVPPGDYAVDVWTADFGTQEQHVTARTGESSPVNFTMERVKSSE